LRGQNTGPGTGLCPRNGFLPAVRDHLGAEGTRLFARDGSRAGGNDVLS